MKGPGGTLLAAVSLDPRTPTPLHRQLYEAVRTAILSRQLRGGTRLPSTRSLAADLGVSRNTVLTAFDQLVAEGYLLGKTGAGTYVTGTIPDELLTVRNRAAAPAPVVHRTSRRDALSPRTTITAGSRRPFEPGLPALDLFPVKLWSRLVARQWSRSGSAVVESLGYGDPAGHRALREAVADYAGAARGVLCEPGQVIITNGTQHALEVATRVLLDPGDAAWIEEPGYPAARATLAAAGARVVLVPVDDHGLDVAAGAERCATPRLVFVTPSHQFPLGVTMSVTRRLQLLELARRCDGWVFEDDYDGEYRHATRPVPAIQGLDAHARVIYAGSFSKVLFPALRLGYLIVPPALVDPFVRARAMAGRSSPAIDQAVVAGFIADGHFDRHIRRMRAAYRERQEALLAAAAKHLGGLVAVGPSEAGMHTIGWLDGIDDVAASRAAAAENIEAAPLSAFCAERRLPDALLLGYGAVTPRQIRTGAETLARALERLRHGKAAATRTGSRNPPSTV